MHVCDAYDIVDIFIWCLLMDHCDNINVTSLRPAYVTAYSYSSPWTPLAADIMQMESYLINPTLPLQHTVSHSLDYYLYTFK